MSVEENISIAHGAARTYAALYSGDHVFAPQPADVERADQVLSQAHTGLVADGLSDVQADQIIQETLTEEKRVTQP